MCLTQSMCSRVSKRTESLTCKWSPTIFHPIVEQLTVFYISGLVL